LCHQLSDGVKDNAKLLVVFLLEIGEFVGQVLVSGEHLPERDEGPHDGNVDLDRPLASQNAREHGHALLGERSGASACTHSQARTGYHNL
jgi:hypothetical protein